MGFLRALGGFVVAALVLAVLAVIFQSSFVLLMLGEVGADIGPDAFASMIVDDLVGFGPIYGALIAIGLLVAFPSASLLHRVSKLPRALVFIAAGLVCMLVMLLAMEKVFFGIQLVAGARTTLGFASQLLAGAIAGFVFAQLTPAPRAKA